MNPGLCNISAHSGRSLVEGELRMSQGQGIVDLSADPVAARAEHRRARLRIVLPILAVVLMIAVILIIAVKTSGANRRGTLELADEVLAANDARIATEVTSYFAVPLRALDEGISMARREPDPEARRALIEKFAIDAMNHVPQIADFIVGDATGDFVMVRRNDGGGIDLKVIDNTPGARKVEWIRGDAAGEEIGRDQDPTDTFDPRTRPWYTGALATNGVYWTDVYVFFTAKEPGVTASTKYRTPEGRDVVVGVDIALAHLSRFLADIKIGEGGRAIIIDNKGHVIAHPQAQTVVQHASADPTTARIDEVGDQAAAGAYDRFRVDGPGRKTITVDGKRYLTGLTPLQTVGRDWSVLIVVPENDFIGFVEHNNRIALVMSLAIVAIAALMAILIVRQGLRGDRAARLVRERSHAMARQSEALDRVADEAELFDPSHPAPPEAVTETAAEVTGSRGASVWYLSPDKNMLHCADRFDIETSRHTSGSELHRSELPQLFAQVTAGEIIEISEAAHDPRTAEVYRVLMSPLGYSSVSIVPMRRRGEIVGAIYLGDPADVTGSQHCLRALASMAALRATGDVEISAETHEAGPVTAEAEPTRSLSADLTLRGLDAAVLGEALYPGVSVLVMRVDGPVATGNGTAAPKLFDAVVHAIQEIAGEHNLPYLKLAGYDIIGVAGFSSDDTSAASRIASVALACRDRLRSLFEESGLAPYFRLGIDCGIAIGQPLGSNPRIFNLWGEAVQTAQVMASSASPGAIQVSEAAYRQLRHGFLLRPRGTFYLPAVGSSQTFILAGGL
jgi:adenylate cyclase